MTYRIYLSSVVYPKQCPCPEILKSVLAVAEGNSDRRYRTQARILSGRRVCATHVIEGLLRVARATSWEFFDTNDLTVVLCLPTSSGAYTKGVFKSYSHVAMHEVIVALEGLGLIDRQPGYYAGDHKFQTAIWPTEQFTNAVSKVIYCWEPAPLIKENLVRLKNYDAKERRGYQIPFSPTPNTRLMDRNLRRINEALRCCAISLDVDNLLLCWVRRLMSREDYRRAHDLEVSPRILDFHRTQLHRTFARKRFDQGGRFHGAWWQSVPSRYRRYIQINGRPTVEYDFSAMHLRLVYAEHGEAPPEEDLYDFGYVGPNPDRARNIHKHAVNAMINADFRGFLMPKKDLDFLGLTQAQLIGRVMERHPLLARVRGKGIGIRYQFIESRVAEAVMLRLLDQGIISLCVHDSFMVLEEHGEALKETMDHCYGEIVGVPPVIKPPEIAQTDFAPALLPSGMPDLHYLRRLHATCSSVRFLDGYFSYVTGGRVGSKTRQLQLEH